MTIDEHLHMFKNIWKRSDTPQDSDGDLRSCPKSVLSRDVDINHLAFHPGKLFLYVNQGGKAEMCHLEEQF